MKKIFWGGRFDEKWWCDYMEGEFEPSLRKDLQLLLKSSPVDRRRLASLEKSRALVKESDEVAVPEDGRYYDQLQERIMKAIDEAAANEIDEPIDVSVGFDSAKRSWTSAVLGAIIGRGWGGKGESYLI